MKRAVAAILWFMTGWWIGAFIAFGLDLTSVLAPISGLALAGLFAGDPFHLVWARPAEAVVPAPVEPAPEAA
jgi:hypothetical protein